MLSAGSEIVYGVCNNFKRERGEGRERARDREREREREETDGAVVQCRLSIRGWGRIEREREMRLMGRWCNVVYPSGGGGAMPSIHQEE